MQDDDRLTPSEKEIEIALCGLKPARTTMNRDHVMFLAGRMSARRQGRIWQGASCLLGLVLLGSLIYRPPATGVRTGADGVANNVRSVLPAQSADQPLSSFYHGRAGPAVNYVRMRRAVLNKGIEALPASSPVPPTEDELPTSEHVTDEFL